MAKGILIHNGSVIEGNATPSDVLSGKTFMSENSDDLQTGTLQGDTLLSLLGFTNIPIGNWVFKSTSTGESFPGFGDDVIPIAMNTGSSCSRSHSNYTSSSPMTTSGSTAINGKTASAINASASKGINRESLSVNASTTAYSVFLPWFYNMDLTSIYLLYS